MSKLTRKVFKNLKLACVSSRKRNRAYLQKFNLFKKRRIFNVFKQSTSRNKSREESIKEDVDDELNDVLEEASNMLADNFRKIYLSNKVFSAIRLINNMKKYGLKFEDEYQQELTSIHEEDEEEEGSEDSPEEQTLEKEMNNLADLHMKFKLCQKVFSVFRVLLKLNAFNRQNHSK